MAKARQVIRQRDFSGGHMVAHAKRRDDEAVVRAGARDLTNSHILTTGAVENRPGRSALYSSLGRTDQVRMSPTATYDLCFGENTLTIRNHATGAIVAGPQAGYSWGATTANLVTWARYDNDIIITYPGAVTEVARWDGVSTWTFSDFAFDVTPGGRRKTPFYRISPKDILMTPGATTGTISIGFNLPVLTASHIGTRMRFVGRQLTILTVASGTVGTATVNEQLPSAQVVTFATDPRLIFNLGDIVQGVSSGARGMVYLSTAVNMNVQLLSVEFSALPASAQQIERPQGDTQEIGSVLGFAVGEAVVGPGGQLTSTLVATVAPGSVPLWDEEVINVFRGYPRSVSVDQNRLIFSDIPGVPGGISWSAHGSPFDHEVGSEPDEGFFEIVPERGRVYHVMSGSDEFVITDKGPYYIPISTSNPLRPGSVDFRRIPGPPASAVRPASTAQGLLYVAEPLDAVVAITGTGQSAQPYIARPASDLHSDLFVGVTCLAVADDAENLVYAVNGTGTMAVGRYQPGKEWVGWLPWNGEGFVYWASALGDSVYLSTIYDAATLVELITPTQYLDAAVLINSVPTAFSGGGTGDLWFFTGTEVDLMDGLKYLGRRTVTLGEIVPQPNDDFSAITVKAGYGWSQAVEPFIGHAQGGQSVRQAIDPRQTFAIAVAVQQSTGFTMWHYNFRTAAWEQLKDNATAYRTGDNQDAAPPQREEVVLFNSAGTEHDPRYQLRKTTPGTLIVLEIADDIGA